MKTSRHDLDLPAWGPYTKKYAGLSHLTDQDRGLRFDLAVFPGLDRRRNDVARVTWDSGWQPWEASVDREYFSHRHQLEWKDRLVTDVAFVRVDDRTRLVRAEFTNRTGLSQACTLHFHAFLNFPPLKTYSEERLEPGTVELPAGCRWIGAVENARVTWARPRPQDGLAYDGLFQGETRDHGFVEGRALGQGFGADRGDRAEWTGSPDPGVEPAGLLWRWRLPAGAKLKVAFEGSVEATVALEGSGDFETTLLVRNPAATPGTFRWTLTSEGGAALETDGFVVGPLGALAAVRFGGTRWNPVPTLTQSPAGLTLAYPDTDRVYGLATAGAETVVRTFRGAELDRTLRHLVHEHVARAFTAPGDEHFTNLLLRPIVVAPGSSRVVWGLVTEGTAEEVAAVLGRGIPAEAEALWSAARATAVRFPDEGPGADQAFGQERLAATLLNNVVFPVYAQGRYLRHSTPGKWWDCLYTWDSGFIGLGLLELDPARGLENLQAYLTDPGNRHAAFLHHGSPVPTQFALFAELWNRLGDALPLADLYPRLRQYYLFLSGQAAGSTTARQPSGLLQTWDYFYNSGGWDDYPPQVHTHRERLTDRVTPVITTAQALRCAKILVQAAGALGHTADRAGYRTDILRWTGALQAQAWDDAEGVFSYVVHDPSGRPAGPLRHESGRNFNRGLDGAYPLVAGVCTPDQEARLWELLSSPEHLWTESGLTTVDQAAPYFRPDGYWNGAVWMAHQWYFWKTALDLGRPEFAVRIARKALDLWKVETEETHACVEHWVVETGRGAGWHQFGGLSSPILNWYAALYRNGRLTVGWDLRIRSRREGKTGWEADLVFEGDHVRTTSVLVASSSRPRVRWCGRPVEARDQGPGAWSFDLVVEPGASGVFAVEEEA